MSRETLETNQIDPRSEGLTPVNGNPIQVDRPTTYKFKRPPLAKITPRWGSVSHQSPHSLAFAVPGYDEPIFVTFNGEMVVGRGQHEGGQPDLDLSPYNAYSFGVSRHHAMIWYEEDTLKIVDLGSSNGTFLNGTRLHPHMPRILRDGDEIAFGEFVTRLNVQ